MGLIEDLETLTGFTVDISFPDLLERKYVGPSIKNAMGKCGSHEQELRLLLDFDTSFSFIAIGIRVCLASTV